MIAFPDMLVNMAKQAGMAVPEDPDSFDAKQYPHFSVFCKVQLGSPMPYPSAAVDNAQVVADVPASEIMTVTFAQLMERGLQIGRPNP